VNSEREIVIYILLSLSFVITFSSVPIAEVKAQTMQMDNATVQENIPNSMNATSSFSSKGTISTLWYIVVNNTLVDPEGNTISSSNITNELQAAAKSIGDGDWSIDVEQGRVRQFDVKIDVINADGTLFHNHTLNNFTSNEEPQISLSPDNTTITIKGKVDVGINEETAWKQVDTTTTLSKNKAITIVLDDKQTDNHFRQQPIYGRVISFVG
jgi:hypothetical protein